MLGDWGNLQVKYTETMLEFKPQIRPLNAVLTPTSILKMLSARRLSAKENQLNAWKRFQESRKKNLLCTIDRDIPVCA